MISKASIIAIGDELLIGQVINSNAAWIGDYLQGFGIKVIEHRAIADTESEIIHTLDDMIPKNDLIILSGGLGATKDDITKKVLADYLDSEMYLD